jgi:hypothetical protein
MDEYNIIPIGDHCAISVTLNDLGKRQCSYPFDWITKKEQINDTNIIYNVNIISELRSDNTKDIVQKYIGDAFNNVEKLNTDNNIIFPHDCINSEGISDVFYKYERRFNRLYSDIHNKKNMFILLTRHYFIEECVFDKIVESLLSYNLKNIIVFISGINHPYLDSEKYKDKVIFKYIYYDVPKAFNYDFDVFRPALTIYFKELFDIKT